MKQGFRKFWAFMLTIAMVIGLLNAPGFSIETKAAIENNTSGITIYFHPNEEWNSANLWSWNGYSPSSWPGDALSKYNNTGWWSISVNASGFEGYIQETGGGKGCDKNFSISSTGTYFVVFNGDSNTVYSYGQRSQAENAAGEPLEEQATTAEPTTAEATFTFTFVNGTGSTTEFQNAVFKVTAGGTTYAMTEQNTTPKSWTATLPESVQSVTVGRHNPQYPDTTAWNTYITGNRGTETTYTADDWDGNGHWGTAEPTTEEPAHDITFTVKDCTETNWIDDGNDRLFLHDNESGNEYEFTLSSGDTVTWTTTIPSTVGSNFYIQRRQSDGTTADNTWSNLNRGSHTTYYITGYSGEGQSGYGIGQWTEPVDIYGEPITAPVLYPTYDGLSDVTDENNGAESLFVVPAIFYNYKPGGGSSWWNQFKNFDDAIMSTYYGENKMYYPLITGAPDTQNISGDAQGQRPLSGLVTGYNSTYTNMQALYYVNHNLSYSGVTGDSTGIGTGSTAVQGLVNGYLGTNGELLSAENNIILPFFSDTFLGTSGNSKVVDGTWATKYGSTEDPLSFPFRQSNGYYVFNSASNKDNIQIDNSGNLTYDSSSSATVENGYAEYTGFFPFDTHADGHNPSALTYGFGARLDIPFNVVNSDGSDYLVDGGHIEATLASNSSSYHNESVTIGKTLQPGNYTLVISSDTGGGITWDTLTFGGNTYYLNDTSWYFTEGNIGTLNETADGRNRNVVSSIDGKIIIPITVPEGQTLNLNTLTFNLKTWNEYPMDIDLYNCEAGDLGDTVFNFSGDDDMWIYVDGKLVLDLGGSHGQTSGSINFTNGTVTATDTATMDYSNGAVTMNTGSSTKNIEGLDFSNPRTTHTMTVFYMERGLYDSNLSISFNFKPVPTVLKNGLTVTNRIDDSDVNEGLLSQMASILQNETINYTINQTDGDTYNDTYSWTENADPYNVSEEVSGGGDSIRGKELIITQDAKTYTTTDSQTKNKYATSYSITDINKEEIVPNENADGTGLIAKDGNDGNTVTVTNKTTPGQDDEVGIRIDYLNEVLVSDVKIEKQFDGTDTTDSTYNFELALTKLFGTTPTAPATTFSLEGVTYTVYNSSNDALVSNGTIPASGIIGLKAGQYAIITGIPVDSAINVTEQIPQDATYQLQGVTLDSIASTNGATANIYDSDRVYVFTNEIPTPEVTDNLIVRSRITTNSVNTGLISQMQPILNAETFDFGLWRVDLSITNYNWLSNKLIPFSMTGTYSAQQTVNYNQDIKGTTCTEEIGTQYQYPQIERNQQFFVAEKIDDKKYNVNGASGYKYTTKNTIKDITEAVAVPSSDTKGAIMGENDHGFNNHGFSETWGIHANGSGAGGGSLLISKVEKDGSGNVVYNETTGKANALYPDADEDAALIVEYSNDVNVSTVRIEKNTMGEGLASKQFRFRVELTRLFGVDGTYSVNGIAYTKYNANGTSAGNATIGADGIVSLQAGQYIMLQGIPVDSTVSVSEQYEIGSQYNLKSVLINGTAGINGGTATTTSTATTFVFTNIIKEDTLEYYDEVGKKVYLPLDEDIENHESVETVGSTINARIPRNSSGNNYASIGNSGTNDPFVKLGDIVLGDKNNQITFDTLDPNTGGRNSVNTYSIRIVNENYDKTYSLAEYDRAGKLIKNNCSIDYNDGPGGTGWLNNTGASYTIDLSDDTNIRSGTYCLYIECANTSDNRAYNATSEGEKDFFRVPASVSGATKGTPSIENGKLYYKASQTGTDQFTLTYENGSIANVFVHNYAVGDDYYVLDYGLKVDMMDDTHGNGLFQNDVVDLSSYEQTDTLDVVVNGTRGWNVFEPRDLGIMNFGGSNNSIRISSYEGDSANFDNRHFNINAITLEKVDGTYSHTYDFNDLRKANGDGLNYHDATEAFADDFEISIVSGYIGTENNNPTYHTNDTQAGYATITFKDANLTEGRYSVTLNYASSGTGTRWKIHAVTSGTYSGMHYQEGVHSSFGYFKKSIVAPFERRLPMYSAEGYSTSITTDMGDVTTVEGDQLKAYYEPAKFMTDVDTFYYTQQVIENGHEPLDSRYATPVMVGKVSVMPATVVYYEDNFAGNNTSGNGGVIYSGSVSTDGTATNPEQANDNNEQYGYDAAYASANSDYSNEQAHIIANGDAAAFEFHGTGFDIMSRVSDSTAIMSVMIFKKHNTKNEVEYTAEITNNNGTVDITNKPQTLYKSLQVNTYYENGDLYQVPVISWKDTAANGVPGDYVVWIKSRTRTASDATTSQTIYIDGIRIYNPIDAFETVGHAEFMQGSTDTTSEFFNNMSYQFNDTIPVYDYTNNVLNASSINGEDNYNTWVEYSGIKARHFENVPCQWAQRVTQADREAFVASHWDITQGSDQYMYFSVDDNQFTATDNNIKINITYYDAGTGKLRVQYVSTDDSVSYYPYYKFVDINGDYPTEVQLTNTNTWKTASIEIKDALFDGTRKQNYQGKFRIANVGNSGGITIAKVEVQKKTNSYANEKYADNQEYNATVKEIKQMLFGDNYVFNYSDPLNSTTGEALASLVKFSENNGTVEGYLAGSTYVETYTENKTSTSDKEASAGAARNLMTYAVNGPNNELYLGNGYGFGFKYTRQDGDQHTIQIAIKNVSGSDLDVMYLNADSQWSKLADLTSKTENYYRLDTLEDINENAIVIKVEGGDGFVSLTKAKINGYTVQPLEVSSLPSGSSDSNLKPTVAPKVGINARDKIFRKNTYVTVTLTTALSVEDVAVINGKDAKGDVILSEARIVTASRKLIENGTKAMWTVKFMTDADVKDTETGEITYEAQNIMTFDFKAIDGSGNYGITTYGKGVD